AHRRCCPQPRRRSLDDFSRCKVRHRPRCRSSAKNPRRAHRQRAGRRTIDRPVYYRRRSRAADGPAVNSNQHHVGTHPRCGRCVQSKRRESSHRFVGLRTLFLEVANTLSPPIRRNKSRRLVEVKQCPADQLPETFGPLRIPPKFSASVGGSRTFTPGTARSARAASSAREWLQNKSRPSRTPVDWSRYRAGLPTSKEN